MTEQIKTYAYHKNSESEDGSFDCFETDVELEGHTHLILKQDHDEIVKKLVDALKFECGNRCAEQNPCNAKKMLKEIGEL